MAFLGYVIGTAALVIAIIAVVSGAETVRRRVLPAWEGAIGGLVVAIFSLSLIEVVSEFLGSVGWFRRVPLAIALIGLGGAGRYVARDREPRADEERAAAPPTPSALAPAADVWARRIAFGAVLVVFAEWLTATVRSFQVGMTAVDATWYHMPTAARFAQSGSTWNLHVMDTSSLTLFYPACSEVLHAVGMSFLHVDALSHVLNLGWLALALLAAWCIGARYGVAPLTLLGAALLFATPQLVTLEAGQALNDVAVSALLLAAVAVIVNAVGSESGRFVRATPILVAAMAAGLAAGTKWTALISVAALTAGIPFLSERSTRARNTIAWLGVVAVTGGYWYLRNLVAAGSPVPPQHLGIGPVAFPYAPPGIPTFSLTQHLNSQTWHDIIRPGLRASFGPVWWLVLLLAVCGLALGVCSRRDRAALVASAVGIACVLSYLLTKQGFTLKFWPGTPRYAAPGLAIGLVMVPVAIARIRRGLLPALLAVYAGTVLVTQFDSRLWRQWWDAGRLTPVAVVACIALLGAALNAVVVPAARSSSREPRRALQMGAAAVVVVTLAGGVALKSYQPVFPDHGIAEGFAAQLLRDRDVRNSRIALSGSLILSGTQYDFYDKRLTNNVQFIATSGASHSSRPFSSCDAFIRALNAGRYRYVVSTSSGAGSPNPAIWLQSNPAARRIDRGARSRATVFEIGRNLDRASCRS